MCLFLLSIIILIKRDNSRTRIWRGTLKKIETRTYSANVLQFFIEKYQVYLKINL